MITEDLDLNDTAQAAQLQRELDRIQELRTKQEVKQGSAVKGQSVSVEMGSAINMGNEGMSASERNLSYIWQSIFFFKFFNYDYLQLLSSNASGYIFKVL